MPLSKVAAPLPRIATHPTLKTAFERPALGASGPRTEITVLDLGKKPWSSSCINLQQQDDDLLAVVGSDCIVVGYPLPNIDDPFFPVWRRGSFAYEPAAPVNGKPIFLIDAATSRGMSGSPIIQVWHDPAPLRSADGIAEIDPTRVRSSRLRGVYGGRAHSARSVMAGTPTGSPSSSKREYATTATR